MFGNGYNKTSEPTRQQNGACPDKEALVKFYYTVLPEDEMHALKRHTNGCGRCKTALMSLDDFQFTWGAANPGGQRKDVDTLLSERFRSVLRERNPNRFEGSRPGRKPTLAYVMIVVLLYPAYLGLFGKPKAAIEPIEGETTAAAPEAAKPVLYAAPLSATFGTAQSFKLPRAVRASAQGKTGETRAEFTLIRTTPFFTLSFFVPIQNPQVLQYDAQILDENREVIAEQVDIQSHDGVGNFVMACNSRLVVYAAEKARYTLVVYEITKSTQAVEEEFRFFFELQLADTPAPRQPAVKTGAARPSEQSTQATS